VRLSMLYHRPSVLPGGEVLTAESGFLSPVSNDDGSPAGESSTSAAGLMEIVSSTNACGDCGTTRGVSFDEPDVTHAVVEIDRCQQIASNVTAAVVEETRTKLAGMRSQDPFANGSQKTGGKQKVHKSSKSSVSSAEPYRLLPKPNAILFPVLLPVVVLAGARHTSAVDTRTPLIAPKRPESNSHVEQDPSLTLRAGLSVCPEFSTPSGSACAAVQSEQAPSVRTQSTQSVDGLRRKAAETQTLPSTGLPSGAFGFVMKESTASQVK
jgi:hypothetical protein